MMAFSFSFPGLGGNGNKAGKGVLVVGATGRTGKRIVQVLQSQGKAVTAGVRDVDKGKETLVGKSGKLSFLQIDVEKDSAQELAAKIAGFSAVVWCVSVVKCQRAMYGSLCSSTRSSFTLHDSATGFSPANGFDIAGPYKTDYKGTVKLIDATVEAGVKKMVLVTSLLTNGAAAGQVFNKNYLLLNLFGLILYWKLQAEKHLMKQAGLDWTIVRPGGLREAPREGNIVYGKADTLFGGALSRDFVADVCAAALSSKAASNKVVEIVALEDAPKLTYEKGFASI